MSQNMLSMAQNTLDKPLARRAGDKDCAIGYAHGDIAVVSCLLVS